MAITLVGKAIMRCRGNLDHLETSRRLLAHSRRLLNRAWWIAGGSAEDLRLTIRERLAKGALFPAPGRVWAAAGTGRRTCVVCGIAISASEIERQMVLGPVTIWAHRSCYTIWQEESERLNDSGHTEATDSPEHLYETVAQEAQKSSVVAGNLGEHKCDDPLDDSPTFLQTKENIAST
jgi:hypothetical protein